jgi:hypothetical protein
MLAARKTFVGAMIQMPEQLAHDANLDARRHMCDLRR